MKKLVTLSVFTIFGLSTTVFAQDIAQSNVPSLIVNNFQQAFPKASDVEWEKEVDLYNVSFEIGMFGSDHEAWYDAAGKLVKHEEEISKGGLPQTVQTTIKSEFTGYRVDDVKKITTGNDITYIMELKSFTEDWKVAVDATGKIVSKVAD